MLRFARQLRIFRKLSADYSQNVAVKVVGMTDDTQIRRQLTNDNYRDLVEEAARALRTGGIIAVPTDTVYGLAADAQSSDAIKKLYEIKGRNLAKPIAICVANIQDVYRWGKVTIPEEAVQSFLPGPFTLVFERSPDLNTNLNPETNLVGIRIPDNDFIRLLAKTYAGPIALTSANSSSEPSTLSVDEFKHLWPKLSFVYDGGRLVESDCRTGSTVIDLSQKGTFHVIRKGSAYDRVRGILSNFPIQEKKTSSLW